MVTIQKLFVADDTRLSWSSVHIYMVWKANHLDACLVHGNFFCTRVPQLKLELIRMHSVEYWIRLNETDTDVHSNIYFIRWRTFSICCTSGWWSWNEIDWWNLHWFIYNCLNRQETYGNDSDVLKWIGWDSSWTILDTCEQIELQ